MVVKSIVSNCKLDKKITDEIRKYLSDKNGKKVRIEIIDVSERSTQLNAYFHGPFLDHLKEYWFELYRERVSTDWMKAKVKSECAYIIIDGVKHSMDTHKMTNSEMIEFLKVVNTWSVDVFGKGIPKPNQIEHWNEIYNFSA